MKKIIAILLALFLCMCNITVSNSSVENLEPYCDEFDFQNGH